MIKKRILLILSGLWFSLVMIYFAIGFSTLKFPHLHYSSFVPKLIMLLLPSLLFAALHFIPRIKKHNVRLIFKIVLWVLLVASIAVCLLYTALMTFGWSSVSPAFFPIYSHTDNPKNYLVLDEPVLCEPESKYFELFPKKLPDNANSIKYRYHCVDTLFGAYWYVHSYYTAPQDVFDSELNRIENICQTYNLTVKRTDSAIVYISKDSRGKEIEKFDSTFFTVIFNEDDRSIEYINSFHIGKDDVLGGVKYIPQYNF